MRLPIVEGEQMHAAGEDIATGGTPGIAMPKRRRGEDDEGECVTPAKRSRSYYSIDRLSVLSDELVLRILSYLPVHTLSRCQRISRRFNTLAGDPEIWKEKYYARFVRPRALRIPGIKTSGAAQTLDYSSKLSKWLDEDHLVRKGSETNWKAQYRLRHNWSKGSCRVKEVDVAQPPLPSALVKYYNGMVVTLNQDHDLRVWRMKDGTFLGEARATEHHPTPTSLAIDTTSVSADRLLLAVGYEDGSFKLFDMQITKGRFTKRYAHPPSSNGAVTSIASTFPYLLTLSRNKTSSLYHFPSRGTIHGSSSIPISYLPNPTLLSSLIAAQAYVPVTASIRRSSLGIIGTLAYCYYRVRLGWNIGLQEILLDPIDDNPVSTDDIKTTSRIAWTPDWLERSSSSLYDTLEALSASSPELVSATHTDHYHVRTKPTSLSYSHPYLLASYPDNTLKVYQVTSNAEGLTISSGRRLWGHTSGVSGAEVSERGKAVSVSLRGNDIRIWELESVLGKSKSSQSRIGNLSSSDDPMGGIHQRSSVQVQPVCQQPQQRSSKSSSRHSKPSSSTSVAHYHNYELSTSHSIPAGTHWGSLSSANSPPSPPLNPFKDWPAMSEECPSDFPSATTALGYIAFDDEQVIILGRREERPGSGSGALVIRCYDFT